MQSVLEVSANTANVISIFLARKNNIHTWWVSAVCCMLFGIIFFKVNLYADVTLQIFFIGMCIYGWINWKKMIHGEPLPVTYIGLSALWKYLVVSVFLALGYGTILYYKTNASFPFIDSLMLVFSITGQFLLMKRKVENWVFWILVNMIAVPLYFIKGLTLTAILYFVLLVNAVVGYKKWSELSQ